jgi:hypothetical protein
MKKIIIIIGITLLVGLISYFDPFHKSVETIDILIGQNFDYAHKMYFNTDPDDHYQIKINDNMNEFHGGILTKINLITDNTVQVYTWNSFNYKSTIWVAATKNNRYEIIDAIRYKNNVRF